MDPVKAARMGKCGQRYDAPVHQYPGGHGWDFAPTAADNVCRSCGNGTQGDPWGGPNCDYCGAGPASFTGTDHVHKFGLRCNGSAQCVGHRYLNCHEADYDSQWGAGIFSDWPRGTSKPYGA